MRNTTGAVQAAGGDMAKAALNAGLVDKLADRQAFEKRLAQLGGEDDSAIGGYQRIKLPAYVKEARRRAVEPARSVSSPLPA